jgi:hypothetical protein
MKASQLLILRIIRASIGYRGGKSRIKIFWG